MEMMEGPVEGMKYDSEDSPNSISPLPPVLRHGLGAVTTFGFLSFFASLGLFAFLTYKLIIWQILPPGEQEESPVSSEPESPTASDVNGFLVPKTAYREEWPPPPPSPRETKTTFMSRIRREPPNQFLILIYNLLFADIQQAVAFMLNVEWLTKDSIDVGTPTCWAQGWFVSVGDLASSVFIAAIGVHTYLGVIKNYRVPTWGFYLAIVGMWSFVYGVTMLGVLVTDNGVNDGGYYVRAGAWCWVNPAYQDLRLYTHYLWIFLALALTWAIYLVIFFHLRFHSKHSPTCCMASAASSIATGRRGSNATISQAEHYPNPDPNGPSPPPLLIPPSPSRSTMTDMTTKRLPPIPRSARHPTFLLYPIIYMLCTTPLAAGRIASMAGRDVKLAYFCYAGSMIASAGWLDVLLYSWTRRSIVFSGGAPPSQDTGLETFAFMRTPEGRQFGNVVFVSGGDGGAKCQQEKRWKRWNEKVVTGASLRTLRGDNIKMASKDSLRGFGMGAGEVMGMAIQCETVTTVSVEQVDQTPTPSRAESRSGNEKDGGMK